MLEEAPGSNATPGTAFTLLVESLEFVDLLSLQAAFRLLQPTQQLWTVRRCGASGPSVAPVFQTWRMHQVAALHSTRTPECCAHAVQDSPHAAHALNITKPTGAR